MQAPEIASFVSDRAATFGFDNLQQLQFCASRLRSLPQETVLAGLLLVFTEGSPPPAGTAAQELAGRLLVALAPKGNVELEDVLRSAISKYELSVEQLLQYLMHLCGKEAVSSTLRLLEAEDLGSDERRALATMQFWVRNLPEHL